MIVPTKYRVSINLIKESVELIDTDNLRFAINEPTKDFFYDPWTIKNNYKNTVFEKLLETLPNNIGEARIITLNETETYNAHCDIDDRYHLNLQGENSYMFDLDDKVIHEINCDGIWYNMNAGKLHSAANLGCTPRIQLVVRQLLKRNNLKNPISICIIPKGEGDRYHFDQYLSKWLNVANKEGIINNFQFDSINNKIKLEIEKDFLKDFDSVFPHQFYSYENK